MVITFGEIMLRLSTPGFTRFNQVNSFNATYGGGEANVAVSLANYGIDTQFVTRLPSNDIGKACMMELKKHSVGTDFIQIGGERIGIYFLEAGAVSRASKVVYDRAHSAFSTMEPGMVDWDKVCEGATWFHWTGISPAVSEGAYLALKEALEVISKKDGITISTDLNYRKKLWKWGKNAQEIMTELTAYCDVVLGNEEDAEMSLGIKPEGVDVTGGKVEGAAYESVSKQIMAKYPRVKKVITTLRGSISASHNSWSGVLWDGNKLYEAPTYQITHIVDRVGGGDSFMGGLIYGLITYPNDDQKALNFAVAASCLKHTVYGDFNNVTIEEVEKLAGGDASGRVSR